MGKAGILEQAPLVHLESGWEKITSILLHACSDAVAWEISSLQWLTEEFCMNVTHWFSLLIYGAMCTVDICKYLYYL